MKTRLLAFLFVFAFGTAAVVQGAAAVAASDADEAAVEEIVEDEDFEQEEAITDEEIVEEEISDDEEEEARVVANRASSAGSDRMRGGGRGAASGAAARAEVETARIGMIATGGAPMSASAAAEARAGVLGIRAAGKRAGATVEKKPECSDKRNPYAVWDDVENCKLKECVSGYALYGGETDNPRCVQKCDIWGGTASRFWEGEDFGVCGSGDLIECRDGFVKTREKTSSSEIEYWHCVPVGTRFGPCSTNGQMNICNIPNGRAQQHCENKFWGLCTTSRLCDDGFRESDPKEVISVSRGKDVKTSAFECVPK